ncbi:thiolase family protein [Nocardia sp. CA-119907]|uniref:thiolase family protein n=1 Tax=Nocardia sp. CA-119907 TaxID=3239973 RepID=UPI003D971D64
MSTTAHIIGVGMTPFDRGERTIESMGTAAALDALAEAGARPATVDAVYCGNVYGGMLPAHRIAAALGLTGRPCYNLEAACSSSAVALNLAVQAIRNRQYDTVLVVGVERLSVFPGGTLRLNPDDLDVIQGVTMPAHYAMRAQAYLAETGATTADLAAIAVKNRGNGAKNPRARFRAETTVEEVLASRPVADPLTLLQCCGSSDGAAAVVVSRYRGPQTPTVSVLASQLSSGTTGMHDMARESLTTRVATAAYHEAGIRPDDLDVVEVHDAFSIAELLYYEALGLCGFGEAPDLLRSGHTSRGGACPVNPGGGLLSRGHPIGATGLAQVVEVVEWLRTPRDDAPRDPEVGLTHCTGGGITGYDHAACAIHVFARS